MHLLSVNLRISNRALRHLCQSMHTHPYSMALAIKFVQVCPYHLMESIPVVCRSQLVITCICCYCSVAKLYLTLCDSMYCSCQASLSMGFSRQEYHFLLPGIFLTRGSNPTMASGFFTTEPPGKPDYMCASQVTYGVSAVLDEHRELYTCIFKEGTKINCSDYEEDITGKSVLSGHYTTESANLVFKRQTVNCRSVTE